MRTSPRRLLSAMLVVGALVLVLRVLRWQSVRFFPTSSSTDTNVWLPAIRKGNRDLFADDQIDKALFPAVVTNRITTAKDLRIRLHELAGLQHARQRMDAVFELGKTLGAQDFSNALVLVKQLPAQLDWQRSVLYSGIFFSHGREQGQQAIDQLLAAKKSHEDTPYVTFGGFDDAFAAGGAIVGWASVDPRAALAYARQQDDEMLVRLAYASWGLNDLDAALADAKALPPGLSDVAGQEDFMSWARSDPVRAFDYAMTLERDLRTTVIERIAHGWASNWAEDYRTDFFSLLSIAVTDDAGDYLQRNAYAWWSRFDPKAAAEDAATLEQESERRENLEGVLTYWAESDTVRTVEWLRKYSGQHEEGGNLAEKIVNNLREVNPEAAARMLDSMPSLADDSDLRFSVFSSWADADPRAAFDWLAGKGINHDTLATATRSVAAKWSRSDPDEALDWAKSLSDKTLQAEAFSGVALIQGYADQNQSADWIFGLPFGEARDRSVCGYVIGVLEHAAGSGAPNEDKLNDAVAKLPQLPDLVQNSSLDGEKKLRLIRLIHGWLN